MESRTQFPRPRGRLRNEVLGNATDCIDWRKARWLRSPNLKPLPNRRILTHRTNRRRKAFTLAADNNQIFSGENND
jgi:hypothetical protein